jgi:aspartate 1-decarboxylase
MMKSKIHRAAYDLNIDYEGSITIDRNLMRQPILLPTAGAYPEC